MQPVVSKILVVEDEPAILRGLQDNLRLEGFEVLTASDGESGYKLAIEAKPDLMILDLMLPRMSGYEVCRKLRTGGVNTPILILTARSEETDRVLGLDLGADDYVTKPFSVRELLARGAGVVAPRATGCCACGSGVRSIAFQWRDARFSEIRSIKRWPARGFNAKRIRNCEVFGVEAGRGDQPG